MGPRQGRPASHYVPKPHLAPVPDTIAPRSRRKWRRLMEASVSTAYPRVQSSAPRIGALARRLAFWCVATLLVVAFGASSGPLVVQAAPATGNPTIKVEGPLASVVASPLSLTPAFDPSITDYVLRCAAGTNTIQLKLSASLGARVNVTGTNGSSIVLQQSLVENQALILDSHGPKNPGGTQYWIRCLPHDFPELSVTRPGNPAPGWYLTGDLGSTSGGSTYTMVLDNHGTPVWYRTSVRSGSANATLLAQDQITWASFIINNPDGAFEVYDLKSQTTRWITRAGLVLDFHELQPLPNGDLMLVASPLRANVNLTAVGGPLSGYLSDCLLFEVDPLGRVVWSWRASDHIAVGESTHPVPFGIGLLTAYDAFHCNSIDVDLASGNILLSARHTSAVYRIDKASGRIIWKLGGNVMTGDGEQILKIVDDQDGTFNAQHDARFQPNGDVSLYDDESFTTHVAARAVQYHISVRDGTAALVWSFQSPDGRNSAATGSFRRLHGGTDNVIGWGVKTPTLFTEVDQNGNVLLDVTFTHGEIAYRVIKVQADALNHDLLRATAGLPPAPLP